jgi:hypothetical protein
MHVRPGGGRLPHCPLTLPLRGATAALALPAAKADVIVVALSAEEPPPSPLTSQPGRRRFDVVHPPLRRHAAPREEL